MFNLIRKFHDDHHAMGRLLNSMDIDIARLRDTGIDPDYYRLCEIVRCFIHLPDVFHHPAEDALYDFLCARRPNFIPFVTQVKREHWENAQVAHRLYLLLDGAFTGHIVPLPELLEVAQVFLDSQESHMEFEDQHVLGRCAPYIGSTEWLLLELKLREQYDASAEPQVRSEFEWLWTEINDVQVQHDVA